jgi:hypothetical protein
MFLRRRYFVLSEVRRVGYYICYPNRSITNLKLLDKLNYYLRNVMCAEARCSNCYPLGDEATVPRDDDLNGGSLHRSSQPTTLVEILTRQATAPKRERGSSLRNGTSRSPKKLLRFATSSEDDEVWCFVQEYETEPSSSREQLWWSKNELEDCYDDGLDILASYERRYKQSLRTAYLSCKSEETTDETVDMCFRTMLSCTNARGLESEVLPRLKHYRKKHRRAVLAASDAVSYSGCEFIREQSIKFSRACRLVATKMGQFDKFAASNPWSESSTDQGVALLPPPPLCIEGDLRHLLLSQDSGDLMQPEDRRMLLRQDSAPNFTLPKDRRMLLRQDSTPRLVQRTLSPESKRGKLNVL